MKVLFQASILHREKMKDAYFRIVEVLLSEGHEVLGETVSVGVGEIKSRSLDEKAGYIKRFKKQIVDCDLVCVEVSYPSTVHMGFKIAYALQKNKPVIALFKVDGQNMGFFDVLESDKLFYEEYNDENLEVVLKNGLDFVDKKSDSRFNFYLPSNQVDYIDEVSKKENLSRSAALRKVISEAMEHDA